MSYFILENVYKTFPTSSNFFMPHGVDKGIQAVRGVSLEVKKGEILALVGESGSGKSTLGHVMLGLYKPSLGNVLVSFPSEKVLLDLTSLNRKKLKEFRRGAQIVFQDTFSALNPRFTANDIVREPLDIHKVGTKSERKEFVRSLFEEVGLFEEHRKRYPHQFSGGQRQRIGLARALALNPSFLLADEPVSALDVSVQAQIVNLLLDLKENRNLTMLIVSHDLPLIRMMADRIAIMYSGKIVEITSKELIGHGNHHPYVEALWAATPVLGKVRGNKKLIEGEPPSPINPPKACAFHPRCLKKQGTCYEIEPKLKKINDNLWVACHLVESQN